MKNKEKEKAKEINIEKIVHELRTPLNAILGYTQLILSQKELSRKNLIYINEIQQCGEQLISMISDISSISKNSNNRNQSDSQHSEGRLEFSNIAKDILQTNSNDLFNKKESNSSKILVVDDSPENRNFVVNTLDVIGFHTKEASDGHQALKLWESWKPDMILLDIYMPEINGHDVIQKIRHKEVSGDHVIIIAVSASSLNNDRKEAFASGCDDFLLKPFKLNQLIALIVKYLNAHDPKENAQHAPKKNNRTNCLLESIKQMPPQWLNLFKESIEMLDIKKTELHIKELEKKDSRASAVLQDWLNQFDFDRMQQLICY